MNKLKFIVVIGFNVDQVQFGDYIWSCDNKDGVILFEVLKERVGNQLILNYVKGCDLVMDDCLGFKEVVDVVKKSDVCIVVVGLVSVFLVCDYSNVICGEGFDLSDLILIGVQEDLVEVIYVIGKLVIVVLLFGKFFVMFWIKENILGIVVQWYFGE